MSDSITHNTDNKRFELRTGGAAATLSYRTVEPDRNAASESVFEYFSTYVPEELRGRGIGGRLVRVALEYARDEGYVVIPSCSFVLSFVERHPEFRPVIRD